ncbi:MAG: STAS domain-containing protein [candidate division KSB1 bacterium]|nr:STAS domain-containing protein [candidate division KSB1 bacterium]MDZ7295807.1 STAS domain-containing protein [candidate division KSB1 bacterium]MDZ7412236.1 STAS domain-containing protein [candidate division KSB1 bacterium]
MAIKEQMHGNVAVLQLKGNLMGGPETLEVHEKVKELVGKGINRVVMDLSKVKWVNSSGLGAMMGAMTTVRNAQGDLRLSGVTEKVQSLLMITKLVTIFETFQTVEEAVASFGK